MDSYMGTIQAFGFPYAPRGWSTCQGQIMSIAQNSAIFSLLGTTYGGNGQTTFGLPDLQGRAPIGQGQGPGLSQYSMGGVLGTENTVLTTNNLPAHTHSLMGTTGGATVSAPAAADVLASANGSDPANGDAVTVNIYGPPATMAALNPASIGMTGGTQPFPILGPRLVINYSICLQGAFPSRN
ncbi:tail fiber protein [Brevundimonas lenta]|uniref:Microcystin-dependent protein n=2 Tax=Brevundimonas lenta TaxID=424796 RepID=A0A7W6NNF4_9CAUL|nr:microcystin-dependent protein [Brevundimonas lenta]